MNKIGFIQITVVPWHIQDKMSELRIRTTVGTQMAEVTEVFDCPDLDSHFDYLVDRAKAKLKDEVKKALAKETAKP